MACQRDWTWVSEQPFLVGQSKVFTEGKPLPKDLDQAAGVAGRKDVVIDPNDGNKYQGNKIGRQDANRANTPISFKTPSRDNLGQPQMGTLGNEKSSLPHTFNPRMKLNLNQESSSSPSESFIFTPGPKNNNLEDKEDANCTVPTKVSSSAVVESDESDDLEDLTKSLAELTRLLASTTPVSFL